MSRVPEWMEIEKRRLENQLAEIQKNLELINTSIKFSKTDVENIIPTTDYQYTAYVPSANRADNHFQVRATNVAFDQYYQLGIAFSDIEAATQMGKYLRVLIKYTNLARKLNRAHTSQDLDDQGYTLKYCNKVKLISFNDMTRLNDMMTSEEIGILRDFYKISIGHDFRKSQ